MIKGRKQWRRKLKNELPPKRGKRFWFHCASLGEFEMARPVIERIQHEIPFSEVVVTFFSPSGYELRKDFLCEGVFYLPFDTQKNAKRWYAAVQPDVVVFVKYEFWLNMMLEGHRRNCEMIGISVLFREGQFFFEPWAEIWKLQLQKFKRIFVQNKSSSDQGKAEELKNIVVAGDIRFDRVTDVVKHADELPEIAAFKGESQLLVGGSTWTEEEKFLFEYLTVKSWPLGWKWIIAPHDTGNMHVADILDRFSDFYPIKYSDWVAGKGESKNKILVIDNVGMLSAIYQYADAAVIGGAWGKGLHNILEAAAFGMPVVFGPKHQKFPEAQEAIDAGFACSAKDYAEFEIGLNKMLGNKDWRMEVSLKAKEFVKKNTGSTDVVMNYFTQA